MTVVMQQAQEVVCFSKIEMLFQSFLVRNGNYELIILVRNT